MASERGPEMGSVAQEEAIKKIIDDKVESLLMEVKVRFEGQRAYQGVLSTEAAQKINSNIEVLKSALTEMLKSRLDKAVEQDKDGVLAGNHMESQALRDYRIEESIISIEFASGTSTGDTYGTGEVLEFEKLIGTVANDLGLDVEILREELAKNPDRRQELEKFALEARVKAAKVLEGNESGFGYLARVRNAVEELGKRGVNFREI